MARLLLKRNWEFEVMLRNFLVAGFRNMARNRLFTAIIVGGLGVAFAAVILIALFIYDKFHAESFIPEAQQIYLIGTKIKIKDQPEIAMPFTAPEIAGIIRSDVPDIRDVTRRYQAPDTFVRQGEISSNETVDWVDPNFFSVFRIPALRGDPIHALSIPDSVVVTRLFAKKYFGKDDVLGQILELNHSQSVRVGAVLEDLPQGTSLISQIYVSSQLSISPLLKLEAARAKESMDLSPGGAIYTYAIIRDVGALRLVEKEIESSSDIRSKYPDTLDISLLFVAMNDLHLHMPGMPNTSMTMIIGMTLAGFLVLLVSGINFVNLMTARASSRAKEIGIRKVIGADRYHLVVQFLGESIIYVVMALFLGAFLVKMLSPFLNKVSVQSISLTTYPQLLVGICVCALLFAILSGSYPALVLSALPPQSALKGGILKSYGSKTIRQILVAAQFSFLISILICTVVMSQQIKFATHDVLNFDSNQTIILSTNCMSSFVNEVRKLQGVEAQFCSSAAPMGQFSFQTSAARREDGTTVSMSGLGVDFDFFSFYGIHPLAGRLLSAEFGADQLVDNGTDSDRNDSARGPTSMIVNEKGMRRLGFSVPSSAIGQVIRNVLPNGGAGQIIGVVPDFVVGPVREEIRPLVFYVDMNGFNNMSIRLSKLEIPFTIAAIEKLWKQENMEKAFHPNFLSMLFDWVYHDIILESLSFSIMSIVALITAGFGLLGLSVYNVQSRIKEIGIRKSIGASRLDIALMLGLQFAKPILWGSLIAWPAAYFAMHFWLQGFAYHVDLKPSVFVTCTIVTVLVAAGAVFLHVWYAARINPSDLLRYE